MAAATFHWKKEAGEVHIMSIVGQVKGLGLYDVIRITRAMRRRQVQSTHRGTYLAIGQCRLETFLEVLAALKIDYSLFKDQCRFLFHDGVSNLIGAKPNDTSDQTTQ